MMGYDPYTVRGRTRSAADVLEDAMLVAFGFMMLPAVLVLAAVDALR